MSTGTRDVNVPAEILLLIVSFVPSQDLWSFYGVNKFLTGVALNQRYGSLFLNPSLAPNGIPANQIRRLRHLSQVVNLRIGEWFPWDPADFDLPKILPVQKKFKNKSSNWFFNTRVRLLRAVGTLDNAKALAGIIPQLTNVSSLSIGQIGRKSWSNILDTAWNTFGKTLTTLRLNAQLKLCHTIIHDSLLLPNLSSFDFGMYHFQDDEMSSTQMISIIVPFINRHQESLNNLELSFHWPYFESAAFFDGLQHIPHLHSFCFYAESYPAYPTAIHRWLAMHSSHLRELRLTLQVSSFPPDRRRIFLQGLILSHLTRLSLLHSTLDTSTLSFIQQHSHSLRHFRFRSPKPTQDEFISLLRCFPIISHNLVFLSLTIKYLTSAIVDILAERFPELVELDIEVDSGFRRQAEAIETALYFPHLHQFWTEMRTRSYVHWKLSHLTLSNGRSYSIQGSCALVLALPNLLTVENLSRGGFLKKHFAIIPSSSDSIVDQLFTAEVPGP